MINNLLELSRRNNLMIRKVKDEYYLTSDNGCYLTNIIGAMIINNIGKDLSIEELSEKLYDKFEESSKAQIRDDILVFIKFLFTEGLIAKNE